MVLAVVAATGPVAVAGTAAGQAQTPSGDEILDRVEQRYGNAETIAGRAVVTRTNGTETVETNVSFAYAAPDSTRFVIEGEDGTVRYGTNGSVAWAVTPRGSVIRDADAIGGPFGDDAPESMDEASLAVPTELNASAIDASVVGTTTVDGTDVYELRLAPANETEGSATTLRVTTDDYRVLRVESSDGESSTTVEVTELRFGVSIHESTFQPPRDRVDTSSFERYDTFATAQASTSLDLPTLAAGTFTEATASVQQGETVVTQRYALDGENVTIVSTTATEQFAQFAENGSTVQIDGRNATVSEMQDGSVVAWTEGNVTTAVVVEGSTDRAVEVARML